MGDMVEIDGREIIAGFRVILLYTWKKWEHRDSNIGTSAK